MFVKRYGVEAPEWLILFVVVLLVAIPIGYKIYQGIMSGSGSVGQWIENIGDKSRP